jgi:hypothetical protein
VKLVISVSDTSTLMLNNGLTYFTFLSSGLFYLHLLQPMLLPIYCFTEVVKVESLGEIFVSNH